MDFDLMRYLMANTKGRLSGAEKAERHLNLCETYMKVMVGNSSHHSLMMFIHDHSQQVTGHLDEAIGFPIDDPHPDYDRLAKKLFSKLIASFGEGYDMAKSQTPDIRGEYSYTRYLNEAVKAYRGGS